MNAIMTQQPAAQIVISVLIKALNEERNIASAIESALAGISGLSGEVILADSASTDRTLEIAKRYPIRIVTLNSPGDRSCGAGGQLGYQYSRGEFICIIDGDMQLHPAFLRAAIDHLRANPKLAGVGGLIRECDTSNVEFQYREERGEPDRRPGLVTRLDCGGVYRREALESVGYFTDRNLHGGEELELATRLAAAGWELARIDQPGIDHFGHSTGDFRLLAYRFTNKTAHSAGEVLKATFGTPRFRYMFRNNNALLLCGLIHGWWLAILATPFILPFPVGLVVSIAVFVFAFPFLVMAIKWRSVRYALYAVSAWNVFALGFWFGLIRPRVDPKAWIDSRVIATSLQPVTTFEGARGE